MSAHNGNGLRLSVREETRRVLTDAIDGHRQDIPIDKSTLSRYCDGQCANPVEMVLAMIHALPADRAALIAGAISDAFEEAHGTPEDVTLEELWHRLDARDSHEDGARMTVALAEFACPDRLSGWVKVSREHARKAELTRRVAVRRLAEMRGRKPAKVAGWRGAESRKERAG